MNDRKQIAIGYQLGSIRMRHHLFVALREFGVRGLIAQLIEPRTQSIASRVFSKHQPAQRDADLFRHDDFVGHGILQHPILMNACFMRECVGPHHGFIRRNTHSRDRREQPAGGINLLERDVRANGIARLANVQRHRNFFQ